MSRRQVRGQSVVEFAPIAIAFFTLCAATIVLSYYLLVGWGGGRALAAVGLSYVTTGVWDKSALITQANQIGVIIHETDTLKIVISKADGSVGPCPAPTGCDGWSATPSIEYGDHVAISLSKAIGVDVQAWVQMPAVSASWSGIAQRDTVENAIVGANYGTISGAVLDDATGAGIVGATVSYSTASGSGSVTSSAGGSYTLANVPNGSVTVTTSALGYVSSSATLTLSANQSLSQSIRLVEGAYVRVFVTSDAATANRVGNDGFDSGTSGWSLAAGALGVASGASGPGTTASNPLEGGGAGTFTAAAGASPSGVKYALTGLTGGTQYSATVWMRGSSGEGYLRLGTDLNYQTSAALDLTSSWNAVTVSWTAGASETSATLVVYSNNGNPVVLDAVRVWESDGKQTGATVLTDLGNSGTEIGDGYYIFTLVPPNDPTTYLFTATASGGLSGCLSAPISLSSSETYLEINVGVDGPGC